MEISTKLSILDSGLCKWTQVMKKMKVGKSPMWCRFRGRPIVHNPDHSPWRGHTVTVAALLLPVLISDRSKTGHEEMRSNQAGLINQAVWYLLPDDHLFSKHILPEHLFLCSSYRVAKWRILTELCKSERRIHSFLSLKHTERHKARSVDSSRKARVSSPHPGLSRKVWGPHR